jgi:hypothetical protein
MGLSPDRIEGMAEKWCEMQAHARLDYGEAVEERRRFGGAG